jgi:hypothetical protein
VLKVADHQVGNAHGIAAVGQRDLLASITAEGANTVTVVASELPKLHAGMVIDILHRTTFAALALDRTITNITSAGVVTYDGADVAATTAHGIYLANSDVLTEGIATRSNENGGPIPRRPFEDNNMESIGEMRDRLTAIDATFYTAARLNTMTMNDMIFALRTEDKPQSIKQ